MNALGPRAARHRHGGAIAIVGAACRLPGASDLDSFWDLLAAGRDAVSVVPADRFTQGAFLHPRRGERGRTYSFAAGTLGDVRGFDPGAFGISPREAAEMDPQQRLLLEVTAEALEDAGLRASAMAGSGTGVFVGASLTDFADLRQADAASGDRWFMTGGALSILANRIGHVFDLQGPAQTVDTACSSALVALHLACESLRAGRLPAAVVGGVNLLLSPFPFLGFAQAGMLSPSGRCHAFDARADGYVRSEGAAVVVLKRLEDALREGDAVRGLILATASNAAGRTVGLSLPNSAAQAALLRQVLIEAGTDPDRLAYFEAHGTGTAAGDPAEATALGTAIGRHRRGGPLPIGSAKTNIGHTEPASGLVGLLKALLVLEKGRIPPSLHHARPNPAIDFEALNLRVPTTVEPLVRRHRAVVGVNSFGFGGTNACALLALPPAPVRQTDPPAGAPLPPLLLSARSAAALRDLAGRWQAKLGRATPGGLPALLRGAARYRDLHPHRLALRGAEAAALAEALGDWQATAPPAMPVPPGRGSGICFVFAGNGGQWTGMGREAAAGSAEFRASLAETDAVLSPLLGWSVARAVAEGVDKATLAASDRAQPLIFAVQRGIVAALAAQGITPMLCLGHSVGEVAAAEAAGLLDLPTAAHLIVARSRHQHARRGIGRMAALGAPADEALPVLAQCGTEDLEGRPWGIEVAAYNAPGALTVAGPDAALARLAEAAAARRWSFVLLDLDYAFHSAAMDAVQAPLMADLAGLAARPPHRPFISSVTGAPLAAADCDAAYWWRNLRAPVRFAEAVAAAAAQGPGLFLEVGPHAVLQGYLRDMLRERPGAPAVLGSLSRRDARGDPFPVIADRCVQAGADPRGGPAFAGPAKRRGLPPTPFERRPIWYAPSAEGILLSSPLDEHPLLGFRRGVEPRLWTRQLDTVLEPWLADHRLAGEAVLPAAAMLEMALAAARACHPDAAALEVAEFAILRSLPLPADQPLELRCEVGAEGAFRLLSRPRLAEQPFTLHAAGRLAPLPRLPEVPAVIPPHAGARSLAGHELLGLATAAGLDYGPAFRPVRAVLVDAGASMAMARLALPAAAPDALGFLLHPVLLDGALQGLIGLLADTPAEPGTGLVPVRFARVVLRRGGGLPASVEIRTTARGQRSAAADLVLRDAEGAVVAVAEGCWLQRIRLPGGQEAEGAYHTALLPALPGPAAELPGALDLARPLAAARTRDAALDLSEPALLLEGFCAAAAHAALAARPASGPYARALLERLAEDGLAGPSPAGLRPVPAPDLPSPREIWRQVLLEQPALAQELAWVATAAERLPQLLSGEGAPPPEAGPPLAGAGFDRLATVLAEAVGAIAAAWPEARPLRVLEVGAGAGPLTARAVAALGARGLRVLYCATGLPGRAAGLPPAVPGLEFSATLWDPLGPAPAPMQADLIIGLGCGAQLRAGGSLPHALRQAAAPGAALLLAEPLSGPLWDFCCGQDPAWWYHPGGASPLPGLEGWSAALAAEGWEGPVAERLAAAPWPAALLAARAPAGASVLAAPLLRRVALFTDAAAAHLRPALVAALSTRGASVQAADLAGAEAMPPRAAQNTLVVAVAGGGKAPASTLAALAQLALSVEGTAAGFRLVTLGGAQPEGGVHSPAAAACFALGRVLANEHPGLKLRRIDLCPSLGAEAAAKRLAAELLTEADAETEVTLTAAGRLVPRLRPGLPPAPPPSGPLQLAIGQPGQLSTLAWQPLTLAAPGTGEVVLRIEAAGLNFRDLMWAQGLLPEDALLGGFAGPGLGMECAGVVEAVGPGVSLRPGERVFGVAPSALATHALTRADALAPMPAGMEVATAAGLPVAFLTAVHALEELARLEPGERVLVHGGAGAVGLAALQVALARGARVAATAGSATKRAFLRAAGAELVLDSRDAGFADAIRAAWGGRSAEDGAVDVVLNSLSGEAMERSLGLLRPFGRFVELGKRDFAENRRVSLRALRHNATFYAVDVDELPRARPQQAARLLAGIRERLEAGTLRPLPVTEYPAAEAEVAFRTLQASGHIGKLVLRPPAVRVASQPLPRPAVPPPARGTVVVLGGVQGFGLAAARWLAEQGVHHLALISRRGARTQGGEAVVRDLAALGAAATLHACDATDAAALGQVLQHIRATMPPIRGVVHAAAVFADGAVAALDAARAGQVLAAKLSIAENLDRLTAEDPLALFLLFSSATLAIGNPGQAAYVAANAALEALARRRRAEGRPATAIQWGAIADAGVVAGDARLAEALRRRLGAEALPAAKALAALPALMAAPGGTLGLARIGWAEAAAALPLLGEPMFEAMRSAARPAAAGGNDLRARLEAAPETELRPLLREALAVEIARILRIPAESVAPAAPLAGFGLDSLGAMELRTALEQRLGLAISLGAMTESVTLDSLVARLADLVRRRQEASEAEALIAAHEPAAAPAEALSDAAPKPGGMEAAA